MFKKLFGTDGIRGKWGEKITPELAFEIGKAIAIVFERENEKNTILVGKDTRLSSNILENSLISGITSQGCNVIKLGVVPTAVVPFSIHRLKANGAVMITASHNPPEDNGFKFFNGNGFRISQEQANHVEHIIANCADFALKPANELGRTYKTKSSVKDYIKAIQNELKFSKNLKICFDCANGASSKIIKKIFSGYNSKFLSSTPNGVNINQNCGAMELSNLKNYMKTGKYDIGFAFDGDADRVIVVMKDGKELSGEEIIYNLTKYNNLKSVVTTKMSNMALSSQFEKEGISCIVVDVGENNVIEGLLKNRAVFGGENNGHYLLLNYGECSDGILAAAQILSVLETNKTFSVPFLPFAKVEKAVRVNNKHMIMESFALKDTIERCESLLAEQGRIFVRASGTEELIRILVEGENKETVEELANIIETEILKLNTI